jgi:hypothetical protein
MKVWPGAPAARHLIPRAVVHGDMVTNPLDVTVHLA